MNNLKSIKQPRTTGLFRCSKVYNRKVKKKYQNLKAGRSSLTYNQQHFVATHQLVI